MSEHQPLHPEDPAAPTPTTDAPSEEDVRAILAQTSGRLSDKEVEAEDEEEEQVPRPPKDPNVEWITVPSIPDQLVRFPHTVRPGPQIDAVFNLSDKTELDKFNQIQAQATNHVDGQTAVIHHLTKEFHQGQFYALVTYSKLYYQKL